MPGLTQEQFLALGPTYIDDATVRLAGDAETLLDVAQHAMPVLDPSIHGGLLLHVMDHVGQGERVTPGHGTYKVWMNRGVHLFDSPDRGVTNALYINVYGGLPKIHRPVIDAAIRATVEVTTTS